MVLVLCISVLLLMPAVPGAIPLNSHVNLGRLFKINGVLEPIRVNGNNEDAIVSGQSYRTVKQTN
jgi:hypothetical protein